MRRYYLLVAWFGPPANLSGRPNALRYGGQRLRKASLPFRKTFQAIRGVDRLVPTDPGVEMVWHRTIAKVLCGTTSYLHCPLRGEIRQETERASIPVTYRGVHKNIEHRDVSKSNISDQHIHLRPETESQVRLSLTKKCYWMGGWRIRGPSQRGEGN